MNCMKKHRKFRHLTEKDRDRLHALYLEGHAQNDMAEVLGVSPSAVCRELARYGRTTWRYSAVRAQADADEKRGNSKRPGMKIEANPELRRHVIIQLRKLRSPDEIAGRLKESGSPLKIGTNAIYKWLYSEEGRPYSKFLCTRRTRKKRQSRLGKKILIPERISFRDKPDEPGLIHAEGDLFVSPVKSHDKASGLIIVVPDTCLLKGTIIPDKTKAVIVPAVQNIFEDMPLDTCTFDNGIENINHQKFGVPAYFCDPHSPWQKPHIESSIGLIRRWFLPKGTNLSTIPDETFQSQLHLLNGKYRKSLGYKSAYEVSLEKGIIKRVPKVSLSKAIAFR